MKQMIRRGLTPQQVMIGKNDQFGNTGIKKQQGTTRILYDAFELDGSQTFNFFENSGSRVFPFTNLGSRGQLDVGESLILARAYFSIFTFDPPNNNAILSARDLTLATDPAIAKGELSFRIAENRVVKTIPVLSFFPEFNKSAEHDAYNNFEFDTQIVIMSLLEFSADFRFDGITTADTALQLTIEGVGSILAPKKPF